MADDLNNLRIEVIELVQTFVNKSIPLLQEHIDEGGHTIQHLQDIINILSIMDQETVNPQNWPAVPEPNQSSSEDSGGPASSSAA